jgi:DNA-binding transcriptional regulator GbsR (MarR family)
MNQTVLDTSLEPRHGFTGYWIPKELSNLGLTKIEQFLLSMIDSLCGSAPRYCFASNSYLAKQMELSESRVSYYLTKLKKLGLIEQVSFDGTERRLRTLKHNWYKPKEDIEKDENSKKDVCVKTRSLGFSKKDLYVKTRRQTTWNQEGRLRESTHHIEKIHIKDDIKESSSSIASSSLENSAPQALKVDDDDLKKVSLEKAKKEDSSDLFFNKTNGSQIRVTQSEIYRFFLKFPKYTTEVIQEAIEKIRDVQGSINNPMKYLQSICETILAERKNPKTYINSLDKTKKRLARYDIQRPIENKPTISIGELMRLEEEKKRAKEKEKEKKDE